MSKNKKLLTMLLRGGTSQDEIASILHCSKRDVSIAAKAIKEYNLSAAKIIGIDERLIDELYFPKKPHVKNEDYLQPEIEGFVERKKRNRKIPIKQFWGEYCTLATERKLLSYSYQVFCEMFSEYAQRTNATKHFIHDPGAKAYIDWAGDVGWLTEKITGAKTKVYVLVICLPFSGRFYVEGFTDMKELSWLDGHMNAFEDFGGVTHMLIPDNCATATDRTPIYITLINKVYTRFAEHYSTAVVPARRRKPRDKSLAESSVYLVEQWIISPSNELTFYTIEEFNEYVFERTRWLNERPFSDKPGSRMTAFEEEVDHLLPLPQARFEMCEWKRAKVSPDYHVRLDYMHYSVDHTLIGKTCDIRVTTSKVEIIYEGEIVAAHPRLYGRKNQYSTNPDHMPDNHRNLPSPWSPDRFTSWAARIGPSTKEAIERVLGASVIVEQAFVPCRNILGLAKRYTPALLEQACARLVATPAKPSYTAVKNTILSIKAEQEHVASAKHAQQQRIDRAQSVGHVHGADAYRRDV